MTTTPESVAQKAAEILIACGARGDVAGVVTLALREHAAALTAKRDEAVKWRDIYKADFESTKKRLDDALDELRCPDCKCGDQIDAESNECGCDSPVCARDGSKTLAEAYIEATAELDKARADLKVVEEASVFGLGEMRVSDEGDKIWVELMADTNKYLRATGPTLVAAIRSAMEQRSKA